MLSRAWSLAQTETMCAAMGALQSPDPLEVPAGTFLSFEMMLQDLEADEVATTVDPGADISAQIAAEVAAAKLAYLPVSLQRDVQKDAHAFLFGEELVDPEEDEDGAEAWKPQRVQFIPLRANGLFPDRSNLPRVQQRPKAKPQPKKRAKQQQARRVVSQLVDQPQIHTRATTHPRVVPTRKSRWEMLSTEMQARIRSTGFELGWDMARHGMPMSNRVFQRDLGGAADKEVIQHAGLDLVDRCHGVLKGGFLIGVHRGKARPLGTWCSSGGKGGSHRSPYDREGESSESSAVDCQDGVMTVRVDDSVGLHSGG